MQEDESSKETYFPNGSVSLFTSISLQMKEIFSESETIVRITLTLPAVKNTIIRHDCDIAGTFKLLVT